RGYDSDGPHRSLAARGAGTCIRLMPTRKRRPAFDPILYQQRNRIERFFNKLKHVRAVAARYDKRDDNFIPSVQLAALRIWLRTYEVGDLDRDRQGRVCRCRGIWR
ncbi:transposase, partial [Paracoccus sp. MKU1]|uniref:transposase n=1 Tax=Paracoccus sp. MKU1 TaxID=1745182 RepID=UPI000A69B669